MTATDTAPEPAIATAADLVDTETTNTLTSPDGDNNDSGDSDVKTSPADTEFALVGSRLIMLLVSLSLGCFLILLDGSIVSTAIPKITDEFHSLADVGWYGSAYQLGSSAVQPLTGKMYTNFSLKWSFISFFFLFEVGSALCGASQSSNMLIVSRAIAGVGASGLINGALVMLAVAVPLKKRPPLMGTMMGIAQFGVVLGPLIGGAFTTGYTWRWCFYINLPLGFLVAAPLVLLHIPEQIPKDPPLQVLRTLHRRLDLLGFVLLASSIIQLLLAVQYGGSTYAWRSSHVIGLFCGAAATFLVWIVWNYRGGKDALLSFPVMRRRRVWMSGICYVSLTIVVFGAAYFLPIYFQAVKGVNAVMSGVYMLSSILPQVAASILGGISVPKVGRIPPFVIAAGVLVALSSGLFGLFQPDTPTGQWVGFQILSGVGRGIGFQMPMVAVQHNTAPSELSEGMTFLVFCQYLGPAIFLTVFNTIFDGKLRENLRHLVPDLNPEIVIEAGATGFRQVVSDEDLPGVLKAYANSLDVVFYIMAGAGCFVFLAGFGMGWNRLSETKTGESPVKDTGEKEEKEPVDV